MQETCLRVKIDKLDSAKIDELKEICIYIYIYIYIYYLSYKAVNICLPVELFLPLKVLVYTLVRGNPIYLLLLLSLVML